ncbi:MAG: ATP-binding protein [Candidatus Dormibacteria bacterium]
MTAKAQRAALKATGATRAQREQSTTAWFRSLLESTGEGICGLDLEGRVTFVNRAATDLLGYERGQMQGIDLHDACHHTRADGTPYPRAACPILRASRTGAGVRIDTELFWKRDGTSFPVEYSSHAIVDLGGATRGIVLTFTDISDRRRQGQAAEDLNRALMATKAELERANLLKSDFLATMSHELRTPLNAIMGFAGLMRNGLAGEMNETAKDYLERIDRNAEVLLALLSDVLDLSRIEADRMSLSIHVLDVMAVVGEVVENMRSLADHKGLVLELRDFTSDPNVLANERAVSQVVTNLLSNAIKFTESGSVIVQVKRDGSRAVIDVVDTGPGIAAEEQELVFEAFRQVGAHARTGTGGTGLGLAISQRLARELGGDLRMTSDLGMGSHFSLELVAASVNGISTDKGTGPAPSVLWATSDLASTQRLGEWVGALGLGFVGFAAPGLLVRAALEMRPAVIAMDLPPNVVAAFVAEIKENPLLAARPMLVVSGDGAGVWDVYPDVRRLSRPFGPEELHSCLGDLRSVAGPAIAEA